MLHKEVNKKVYEKFIGEIEEEILQGRLKKGDRLPTERELSEIMNISRPSIREGMRILESRGVVESIPGEGNFISCNSEKSLLQPLLLLSKLKNVKHNEAFELRKILELENVRLAALKAKPEDSEELLSIIYKMNREIENEKRHEILAALDREFHSKIASIGQNNMIKFLCDIIVEMYGRFIEYAHDDIIENNMSDEKLHYQHEMICNAIINNNCEAAVECMKEHMEYVEKKYISRLNDIF